MLMFDQIIVYLFSLLLINSGIEFRTSITQIQGSWTVNVVFGAFSHHHKTCRISSQQHSQSGLGSRGIIPLATHVFRHHPSAPCHGTVGILVNLCFAITPLQTVLVDPVCCQC